MKVTLTFPDGPVVAPGQEVKDLKGSPVGVSLGPVVGIVSDVQELKSGPVKLTIEFNEELEAK